MKLVRSFLIFGLLLLLGCKTYTANISWKHAQPNVAIGFKLYCGKYANNYPYQIDLGNQVPVSYEGTVGVYKTTKPVTDRQYREIRYCSMSAYNSSGSEGPLSAPAQVTAGSGTLEINMIRGGE